MARRFVILAIASCPLLAEQANDFDKNLLPAAHSCTFCQKDRAGPVILKASFLIWQSKEWGFEFASKSRLASDPASDTQTFQQKLSIPDFSWSPGFKVDLGTNLPYDGWDLNNRWTYYHGDCTNLKKHFDSQIAPTGFGIVPLWHYPFFDIVEPGAPLRFQTASANWNLFFNSFDVDLGRCFSPMKSLLLRMHMGAKGSWIRQRSHVEYEHSTTVNGIIQPPTEEAIQFLSSRMAYTSRAWGIGPRGGLESKWKFGWGFSLVAEGAFSFLCTYMDLMNSYHDRLYNFSRSVNENNDLQMKEHRWELIPVFEGNIGVDWGYCFGCKNKPIYMGITLAYEMQYWWSQNHAQRNFAVQAPGNMWDMRGDLQMHGLTASIRSDF